MSDLRKYLELIDENNESDSIELYDSFDIEINDDFVIESGVVGFTNDGIIIEGDDMICKLLGINGALLEDVDHQEYNDEAGMFKNDLQTIQRVSEHLEKAILDNENLPEWCQAKIAQAKGMVVSVMDYMISQHENGKIDTVDEAANPAQQAAIAIAMKEKGQKPKNEGEMDEAKYQGREVPLGKPMAGDVKKSKVYVRKPNGKVVKVNFGDKKMRIKKSNPGRRKNFRARHNCENPGPRWKARYWSCRAW